MKVGKLFAIVSAAVVAAAVAAPSAADARPRKKHRAVQSDYVINAQGYKCPRAFSGIDCSNVYANTPDPQLNAQIISDFRRGLYSPSNR